MVAERSVSWKEFMVTWLYTSELIILIWVTKNNVLKNVIALSLKF